MAIAKASEIAKVTFGMSYSELLIVSLLQALKEADIYSPPTSSLNR